MLAAHRSAGSFVVPCSERRGRFVISKALEAL